MKALAGPAVALKADVGTLAVVDANDQCQGLEERYESDCTDWMTQIPKLRNHRSLALPWECGFSEWTY